MAPCQPTPQAIKGSEQLEEEEEEKEEEEEEEEEKLLVQFQLYEQLEPASEPNQGNPRPREPQTLAALSAISFKVGHAESRIESGARGRKGDPSVAGGEMKSPKKLEEIIAARWKKRIAGNWKKRNPKLLQEEKLTAAGDGGSLAAGDGEVAAGDLFQ
ncbi:hypothetical protein LWI29_037194 [Acer saccharum]|uniref:Uncharacterized protein n=1 Tax=Acer saccharum TaxID=4024 RepID=A0AA39RYD3_ACESA|nr:hypothetical protein LWI29_037194 [Acer saccharum]